MGSKFTQNALAGELKRSPRPLADFRGRFAAGERERRGRGRREMGKEVLGRERGRGVKGRGERWKGEGGGTGRGGGVCVIGFKGDRRPCSEAFKV